MPSKSEFDWKNMEVAPHIVKVAPQIPEVTPQMIKVAPVSSKVAPKFEISQLALKSRAPAQKPRTPTENRISIHEMAVNSVSGHSLCEFGHTEVQNGQ